MGSQTREVISPREGQQGNWSPRCPVGARQASPDLLALAPCLHQDVGAWLSGSPCASGLISLPLCLSTGWQGAVSRPEPQHSEDLPHPFLCMQEEMQSNVEVVHTYRQHIVNDMNPGNLHLFINAYNRYGGGPRPGGCCCSAPGWVCTVEEGSTGLLK